MATTDWQDNKFGRAMLDQIVAWVSEELEPQDVYDEKVLGEWAESNGYAKTEE